MKDAYGHEIPIIEDKTMDYFDNAIEQLKGAHEELSADNAAAAQAEYGRRPAMVNVPLLELVRLLGAGDHLHALVDVDYARAKADWMKKADVIRALINES